MSSTQISVTQNDVKNLFKLELHVNKFSFHVSHGIKNPNGWLASRIYDRFRNSIPLMFFNEPETLLTIWFVTQQARKEGSLFIDATIKEKITPPKPILSKYLVKGTLLTNITELHEAFSSFGEIKSIQMSLSAQFQIPENTVRPQFEVGPSATLLIYATQPIPSNIDLIYKNHQSSAEVNTPAIKLTIQKIPFTTPTNDRRVFTHDPDPNPKRRSTNNLHTSTKPSSTSSSSNFTVSNRIASPRTTPSITSTNDFPDNQHQLNTSPTQPVSRSIFESSSANSNLLTQPESQSLPLHSTLTLSFPVNASTITNDLNLANNTSPEITEPLTNSSALSASTPTLTDNFNFNRHITDLITSNITVLVSNSPTSVVNSPLTSLELPPTLPNCTDLNNITIPVLYSNSQTNAPKSPITLTNFVLPLTSSFAKISSLPPTPNSNSDSTFITAKTRSQYQGPPLVNSASTVKLNKGKKSKINKGP